MHAINEGPSSWLRKYAPLIPSGGVVLDLACGSGRNARWLAQQGWPVEAVDRDPSALAALSAVAGVSVLQADLEAAPWPYAGQKFAGIVVCRYLHRPLLPRLAQNLAKGGVLIYETFMQGQECFGRPRNPNYLLLPDELLDTYSGELEIIAFAQGEFVEAQSSMLQCVCARRPL
jgi:SAM-dependent methyltransferase